MNDDMADDLREYGRDSGQGDGQGGPQSEPPGDATDDARADATNDAIDSGALDIELTVVTMTFDASDNAALLAVLSKYIVLTRMQDGCRNVDLCSSVTKSGRHLVIQKWDSADDQRRHFDSDLMIEMAKSCSSVLSSAPDIDLWDATSAHDLR